LFSPCVSWAVFLVFDVVRGDYRHDVPWIGWRRSMRCHVTISAKAAQLGLHGRCIVDEQCLISPEGDSHVHSTGFIQARPACD